MKGGKISKSFTELGMPTHQQLVVPIAKAFATLGRSAEASEAVEEVKELVPISEDLALVMFPNRPNDSFRTKRIDWEATRC